MSRTEEGKESSMEQREPGRGLGGAKNLEGQKGLVEVGRHNLVKPSRGGQNGGGGGMGRRIHNRKKESPGVLTANFPPLFYAGLLP